MNTPAESSKTLSAPDHDPQRFLRYAVRLPMLVLHVLIAPFVALFFVNGLTTRWHIGDQSVAQTVTGWWSRRLLRIFGFRIRVFGAPLGLPVLFVANHTSWLDIEVVHTQLLASFIAKSEIANWPLVGWLSSRAGTIFHRRGSTHSLSEVIQVAVERLQQGRSVAVFPEGGTGSAERLRTFHARVFQIAVDAGVPVQPLALRYGCNGEWDATVPFSEEESFLANFFRVLGGPARDAELHFLVPIDDASQGRRHMAEAARAQIQQALGYVDE